MADRWGGDTSNQAGGAPNASDPGGMPGWYNGLKSAWNGFTGDPKGVMDAYTKAIQMAGQQGQQTRDWLQGQQQAALAKYGPIQGMFSNMYGTGGIAPAQVPGAGGQPGAIGQTFGGQGAY